MEVGSIGVIPSSSSGTFFRVVSYIVLVVVVIFFLVNIIVHYIEFRDISRLQTQITSLAAEVNSLPPSEPPILKYSVNSTTNTTPLGPSNIINQLTYISNASSNVLSIVPVMNVTLNSNISTTSTVIAPNTLAILWTTSTNTYLRVL